jgi:hypothetical protein
MKDILIGIIGFYMTFLVMSILIIGGVPTDTRNMILVCVTIYIPLILPLGISILGLKAVNDEDRAEIKDITKISMWYFVLEIVFYFFYFHLAFTVSFFMFTKAFITMIVSLIALIIIIKACKLKD